MLVLMKKLATGRWIIGHLIVIVMFIVLVNLGLWQLRRLDQRRERNAEIMAGLNQPATVLTGQPVRPDELNFHRVSTTGMFDNNDSVAIRNRPFNGLPGVHLLTPLHIEGSEQAVLVDRGWIPLEDAEPERWSSYAVEGEVTIEGIAKQKQPRPAGFLVPTDPTPGPGEDRLEQWFRVDIDRIQEQLSYPLLPIFIEQSPDGQDTPPLQEGDPVLDEGPHLSYALQWFSFSLILLITYGALMRQEIKRTDETPGMMPKADEEIHTTRLN